MKRSKSSGEGKFVAIPLAVIKTTKWASLNAWAIRLLVELGSQYNGGNNGDLSAAFSVMRHQGWRSKATLSRALRDLERVDFIVKTRQGWNNHCSLYALTWKPIDECIDRKTGKSKHSAKPTIAPPGTWRDAAEAAT